LNLWQEKIDLNDHCGNAAYLDFKDYVFEVPVTHGHILVYQVLSLEQRPVELMVTHHRGLHNV